MSALLLQIVLLAALIALYLLVGSVLIAPAWLPSRRRPNLALALVVGFAGTPVLLGPVSFLSHLDLGKSALAIAGSAFVVLGVWWRRTRPRPSAGSDRGQAKRESPLTARTPLYVWLIGVALALLACWAYLLWSTEAPAGGGKYYGGSTVFDFQKHIEIVTALTAYGMPGQHEAAPGTPLVWYTGFYTAAAAIASLVPAGVLQALVAQIFTAAIVFVLLASLICAQFWPDSAGWRFAGTLVMAVGLSVTPHALHLEQACATSSWLSRILPPAVHVDSQIGVLMWLAHHVLAAVLTLWVLINLRRLAEWSRLEWVVFSVCSACAIAFSSSVGMLYLAAAFLTLLAAAMRARLRPKVLVSLWREQRGTVGALVLSIVVQAGVLLCYYWPVLRSLGHGGGDAKTSVLFSQSGSADVLQNVGWALESCGLGLLAWVLRPWLGRWRPGEGAAFAFAVVAVMTALTFGQASAMQAHALITSQVILSLFAVATLQSLLDRRWKPIKWAGGVLGVGLAANLLVCLCGVGLWWTNVSTVNAPRISAGKRDLVDWVHQNTARTDLVTEMEGDHTVFNNSLDRAAAASGNDMFPGPQEGWGDQRALARYEDQHGGSLDGVLRSDYVYVPYEPTGYGVPKHEPLDPAECKEKLLTLGFTIVRENAAGLIARRGQIPPGDHTDLLRPGGGLAEVRKYVQEGAYSFALRHLDLPGIDKLKGAAERHYLLGVCLQELGERLPEALAQYNQALAMGFDEYKVRRRREELLLLLGKKSEAQQDERRCKALKSARQPAGGSLS